MGRTLSLSTISLLDHWVSDIGQHPLPPLQFQKKSPIVCCIHFLGLQEQRKPLHGLNNRNLFTYGLGVWESEKSEKVWEINAFPEGFGGGSFLTSSSLLVVASNPRSYVIPVSTSIITGCFPVQLSPNFPLSIRTPVLGLGLTLIQYDLMLTGLPQLIRPYFQIRSPSQIPRIRTSSYLLRGHNSIYNMCVFMWDRAL